VDVRNRRAQGAHYEDMACSYLEKKGYRILDRNVHLLKKEVDIIALDHGTVVFVEVKGRRSARFGRAFEAVGTRKQRHLVQLAGAYLGRHRLWDRQCRFDVVSVVLEDESRPRFEHIQNAFGA
jgi:putative endonuclease